MGNYLILPLGKEQYQNVSIKHPDAKGKDGDEKRQLHGHGEKFSDFFKIFAAEIKADHRSNTHGQADIQG